MFFKKVDGATMLLKMNASLVDYKAAIKATSDYLSKCQDDIRKLESKKREEFDGNKIPSEEIKRLEKEIAAVIFDEDCVSDYLFDNSPASIDAAVIRISLLQYQKDLLEEGWSVDALQNSLDDDKMLALQGNAGLCEKRLVFMHEYVKMVENAIEEIEIALKKN